MCERLWTLFKSKRTGTDQEYEFSFNRFEFDNDSSQVWRVSEHSLGKNAIYLHEFKEYAVKRDSSCLVARCKDRVAGFLYAYVGSRDEVVMKEFNLNVLDGGEEPISANAGVDEAIHVMISDKKSKEWIDQDFKFVLVIKALAVHPDFQKLGLGKELLMRMLYDIIFVQQLKFQVCSALAWYKGIGNDAHSAVIFKSVGMQEVYRRDQYWKAICNRAYSCPLKDIEDFIDCKCGAALFVGFFAAANAYVDDWRSRHLIV